MDASENMNDLLSALSQGMGDEEAVLSVIQSMIASEIIIRRIDKHMTQKDFAAMLGTSQSTLSKWESGETNFTLSSLVSIASKLGIAMQSPFVQTPPKAYHPAYSNVIAFPLTSWSSASTDQSCFTSVKSFTDEESIEM